MIKQKDVNFQKLISPEVDKLVRKRRRGLSWREILEERRLRREKHYQNFNIILVSGIIGTSCLVLSLGLIIRSKYRKWKERKEETESIRDLYQREEKRLIKDEEKGNKQ